MTTMLSKMLGALLCALLCAVVVHTEFLPQKDFDLQQVSGKWYLIGFATNAQWFVNKKAIMKMGTTVLTPTADGDLNMVFNSLNSDGSCFKMTNLAKKTEIPGRFTFQSQRWGNDNDMRVVDVMYDQYALVHIIKTKGGASTVLNKLYGRSEELSPEVLKKFEWFSLKTGVLPDNIAVLSRNEECPSA